MPMSGNPVRARMPVRTSPKARIRRRASTSSKSACSTAGTGTTGSRSNGIGWIYGV